MHVVGIKQIIQRALVSYAGVTTSNGHALGTTLVDSNLSIDYDGQAVLISSGSYTGQTRDIDGDTSGGTVAVSSAFGGQILAGTAFFILSSIPAMAEFDDIKGAGWTNENLTTIDANLDSVLTRMGYEGATSLAAKLTAARAGYLDELAAANIPADVDTLLTRVGTATDNADLGTLFGRHKRAYLGTHVHALLVVTNAASLNADLDTALRDWLLDIGFVVTVCDPADVAANLEVSSFDMVVVSASCVAGDSGNLANLRTVEIPVICHSAAIAVSTVFNMGTTASTKAAQTQIEITDNSAMWLIDQTLANLTVTASATIYTIATAGTNVVEFGQEADGTNLLTLLKLPQGEDDDGTVPYAPFFDRYFIGVADFTNVNAAFKALLENLCMHCVMEKRFLEDEVVNARRVYQEQIPDTAISISPDATLSNNPPSADTENSVVDIDKKTNRTFVLRSLFIDTSALGAGTATMTFKLWVDIGGTPAEVDSVDVTSTGYQNLMDIFGLQEVHADSIHITAQVNVGTGTIAGIYRYAEAKK